MPSGLFYICLWSPFPVEGGVWFVLLFSFIIEIPTRNANSVDPDQTPHDAASDLGLHVCHIECHFHEMNECHFTIEIPTRNANCVVPVQTPHRI